MINTKTKEKQNYIVIKLADFRPEKTQKNSKKKKTVYHSLERNNH